MARAAASTHGLVCSFRSIVTAAALCILLLSCRAEFSRFILYQPTDVPRWARGLAFGFPPLMMRLRL